MKRFAAALVAALVVSGCAGEAGQGTASAPTQTSEPRATTIVIAEPAAAATAPDTEEYLENFEFVWATVNQEFYDPTFGGVDWESAHERYLPQVGTVDSDEALLAQFDTPLTIDFDGATLISASFADELIARLVKEIGPTTFFGRVRLINLSELARRTIDAVIAQRLSMDN